LAPFFFSFSLSLFSKVPSCKVVPVCNKRKHTIKTWKWELSATSVLDSLSVFGERERERESHLQVLTQLSEADEAARKAVEQKLEEDRRALELPDTPNNHGFSISVNSVDRFGRASQVKELVFFYYLSLSLSFLSFFFPPA